MGMRYAIVVRHPGFVDRMLRSGAVDDGGDMARSCCSPGDGDEATFRARADAEAEARDWGGSHPGYRFVVAERVMRPAWKIEDPGADWQVPRYYPAGGEG